MPLVQLSVCSCNYDLHGLNTDGIPARGGVSSVGRNEVVCGMMVRFNVFLDDQEADSEMGYNRGNQYIYFYVTPGQHVISSKAENWAEITVTAKAGEVIYLKQEVEVGVVMARNSLKVLNDVEGRYLVKDAALGTIAKESK